MNETPALPLFHAGVPRPVAGMTVAGSVAVLAGWAVAAGAVALWHFCRRDVTA
jgi:hypothetical protein